MKLSHALSLSALIVFASVGFAYAQSPAQTPKLGQAPSAGKLTPPDQIKVVCSGLAKMSFGDQTKAGNVTITLLPGATPEETRGKLVMTLGGEAPIEGQWESPNQAQNSVKIRVTKQDAVIEGTMQELQWEDAAQSSQLLRLINDVEATVTADGGKAQLSGLLDCTLSN